MKTLSLEDVQTGRRGPRLDFVISGKSLLAIVERRGHDLVPRLGGGLVPIDQALRALLLCETDGDTPSGGVALYICPECGDYGCGVISAKISVEGGDIIWSDFGYENDYDGEFLPITKVGPFRFSAADYRRTILDAHPR